MPERKAVMSCDAALLRVNQDGRHASGNVVRIALMTPSEKQLMAFSVGIAH
jgi:hypothetical protein